MPGQHKALDNSKQDAICNLVAGGLSLRQAARYVECDPKSIRREMVRNDDFRRRLEKSKSEASIRPVQTLLEAAQEDWRAALSWMERIDPDRFARPDAAVVTKREANKFVADLITAVETAIKNTRARKRLFRLLTPAMPTAMRRNWEINARRRAAQDFDRRQAARLEKKRLQRNERDDRRWKLWGQIGEWLPNELYEKLRQNEDLFDPEEVFPQSPGDNRTPSELIKDAFADVPKHYKPGSQKSDRHVACNMGQEKGYGYNEWLALSMEERQRHHAEYDRKRNELAHAFWPADKPLTIPSRKDATPKDASPHGETKGAPPVTKGASPATPNSPPLGRLPVEGASPTPANPKPLNDLQ